MVQPAEMVWVEVAVPSGDPLWELDAGRAFVWLGHAWAGALDLLGLGPAAVHEGALVRSAWSAQLCFAGLGPGEVSVGGRKVVGMSQRRTREGAVFSCAAYLRLDPGAVADLLALSEEERASASAVLASLAAPLGASSPAAPRHDEVEAALLAALARDTGLI